MNSETPGSENKKNRGDDINTRRNRPTRTEKDEGFIEDDSRINEENSTVRKLVLFEQLGTGRDILPK